MDSFIPIMIPLEGQPSRCPNCQNPEDIKRTCRSCGHEYVDPEYTGWEIAIAIFIVIALLVVVLSVGYLVMVWLFDGENRTLLEHCRIFMRWLANKRLW